jgi:hypothetical protein
MVLDTATMHSRLSFGEMAHAIIVWLSAAVQFDGYSIGRRVSRARLVAGATVEGCVIEFVRCIKPE